MGFQAREPAARVPPRPLDWFLDRARQRKSSSANCLIDLKSEGPRHKLTPPNRQQTFGSDALIERGMAAGRYGVGQSGFAFRPSFCAMLP